MRKKNLALVPKQRDPEAFGAFMPDGSYNADAPLSQRGPADRFVRAMVASRNGPSFPPALAAEAIGLAKQEQAFPNHAQWATAHERCHPESSVWPFVWTSTAAEEAVKRCGLAVLSPTAEPRHWCGERWVVGDEKNCPSQGHRREMDMARVRGLVEAVIGKLAAPLRDSPDHPSAAEQIKALKGDVLKATDETWPGWKR